MSDMFDHAADAMDSLIDVEYNGRHDYEGCEEDDDYETHWQYFYGDTYSEECLECITGKYLFFSKDRSVLTVIAAWETMFGSWCEVGKISMSASGGDYVLCLYDVDDRRKHDLAKVYGGDVYVKYRYWKSDEDTRNGVYSAEFKSRRRG